MAKYYYSPRKQKIMALLASGAVLALSPSPKVSWRVIRNIPKVWKEIDREVIRRTIREFKYDRLVDFRTEKDGFTSVVLTEKGKRYALRFNPERIILQKPARWDGKWRFIIFDIPEKRKTVRDAFRKYLSDLGFYQIQRSVWVWPYECKKEVDFLVELFEIRSDVYYLLVEAITNEALLQKHFQLSL